jgi:glycosyltransferase domain-containing protein
MPDFLSDLTLVIPAYNRPAYLARQIDYWAGTGVQLCILDGSKQKAPDDLIARMGTNVHYEYMPIGFNERLVHASQIVKTKYVALLGDDELYAKQGLQDCLNLLDLDPRLIGCVGRSLFFFHREGEIYGHQVYEKSQDVIDMYGDGLSRLRNSFPEGDPSRAPYLLYGVFRRDQWATIFNTAYSRHFSSGYVYELAVIIIGACLGPTKMVDSLVWFRSGENPAMSSAAVNRKIGTGEWGTSPDYVTEYEDFVQRITEVLTRLDVASASEAEQTVREVAVQFFAYSLHKPHRPIAYWRRVLSFAAKNTPRWMKTLLKRNMTKTLGTVLDYKGVMFNDALQDLKQNGVAFSPEEMKSTRSFLIDFHSQLKNA